MSRKVECNFDEAITELKDGYPVFIMTKDNYMMPLQEYLDSSSFFVEYPDSARVIIQRGQERPSPEPNSEWEKAAEVEREGSAKIPRETTVKKAEKRRTKAEIERDTVIDLWNAGNIISGIAEKMKVTEYVINKYLERFEVIYGEDAVRNRRIPHDLPEKGEG